MSGERREVPIQHAGLKYVLTSGYCGRWTIALKLHSLALFKCAALVLAAASGIAVAETASAGCSSEMQAAYPKASISNGPVQAVLYLPDANNGYYRASRFDWSGVLPCLAYKGHTYFGVWFSHRAAERSKAIASRSRPAWRGNNRSGIFHKSLFRRRWREWRSGRRRSPAQAPYYFYSLQRRSSNSLRS